MIPRQYQVRQKNFAIHIVFFTEDIKWVHTQEDETYWMFEQHSDLTQNVKNRHKEDIQQLVQQGKQDAALDLHLKESVQLFYSPNPAQYRYKVNYKQVAPDGSLIVPSAEGGPHFKRRSLSGEQSLTVPSPISLNVPAQSTTPTPDEKKPDPSSNKLFGLLKKKVSTPTSPSQQPTSTTTTTTTDAAAAPQAPRKSSLLNKLTNRTRGKSLRTLFVKTSKDSPKDGDEEEKDDEEDLVANEVKQEMLVKFQKASEELDEVRCDMIWY